MVNLSDSGFSSEQTSYLSGFVSGILQGKELPFLGQDGERRFTHEPEQSIHGTPLDDLCKEERIKHEQNGLDCYDAILANATAGVFPQDGDVFRYKFHGLFFVSPAQESLMLRCRIAGGALTSGQWRGLAGITCVMIYHDTRRTSWRLPLTATRFFGIVLCFAALGHAIAHPTIWTALLFGAAVLAKMIPEARRLNSASTVGIPWSPDLHSARLQLGPLRRALQARFLLALAAPLTALANPWLAPPLLLAAELLERQLFFQSVHAPKMPGSFTPASRH